MAAERPPVAVTLFRLLLVLGLFGTLAHAGRAAWISRARRQRTTAVASLVACLLILRMGRRRGVRAARAAQGSPQRLQDRRRGSRGKRPRTGRSGQTAAAIRLPPAGSGGEGRVGVKEGRSRRRGPLLMARSPRRPRRWPIHRARCASSSRRPETSRRRSRPVGRAVARLGSTEGDYTRFVSLVLSSKGRLPADERKELDAVVKHLREERTGDAYRRCSAARWPSGSTTSRPSRPAPRSSPRRRRMIPRPSPSSGRWPSRSTIERPR